MRLCCESEVVAYVTARIEAMQVLGEPSRLPVHLQFEHSFHRQREKALNKRNSKHIHLYPFGITGILNNS